MSSIFAVDLIYGRVSALLPTAGSRLRMRASLSSYMMAVRVGNVLGVLVDLVISDFIEKHPVAFRLLAASASGNNVVDRIHILNTQILTDFVAPRLKKLDASGVKFSVTFLAVWTGVLPRGVRGPQFPVVVVVCTGGCLRS